MTLTLLSKATHNVDELSVLEQFHQAMHTVVGSVDDYRHAWIEAGFSPTAAEQMAVQFHWLIMEWPPANVDVEQLVLMLVPRVSAFRQAWLTADYNEMAAELMAIQYHWHFLQQVRASTRATAAASE